MMQNLIAIYTFDGITIEIIPVYKYILKKYMA